MKMNIKAGEWLQMTPIEKIVMLLDATRKNGIDITKRKKQ